MYVPGDSLYSQGYELISCQKGANLARAHIQRKKLTAFWLVRRQQVIRK